MQSKLAVISRPDCAYPAGGLDWAFSEHWIVRGEYIYDGFGSRLYDFKAQDAAGFDSKTVKLQEGAARSAVAYKF